MNFLKWIISSLYKDDLEGMQEKYVTEAKAVLDDAKEFSTQVRGKIYVHYERANTSSDEFLYGITPVLKNNFFISWLNEQKTQWQQLIKKSIDEGDKDNAYLFSVKMSLIDDLFTDLRDFEYRYNRMLNQKEEGQSGGTKQY